MEEVAGSEFEMPADLVLLAMGFVHPVRKGLVEDLGIDLDGRGNLLNPNYACEAYRYSQVNHSTGVGLTRDAARVSATGLTRYVTEDQLSLIRSQANNLLPRFMNMRVVMTNNVDVTPALAPSLRSMSVMYRLIPQ